MADNKFILVTSQSSTVRARLLQQEQQLAQLFLRKVAQLFAMEFPHGLIEVAENPQAFRRDACLHDAPVLDFARARDQSARFHAVEQARDVGVARDQPATDFAASQAASPAPRRMRRMLYCAPERPAGLQQCLGPAGEGIRGPKQADKDLALRIALPASGICVSLWFPLSCLQYSRYNDYCQEEC